jgi:aminopeptidase
MPLEASEAVRTALKCVMGAKKDENLTILCDHEKTQVCEPFAVGALRLGLRTRLVTMKPAAHVFREKVPSNIAEIFRKHGTDIYINLLRDSREETTFRIQLTKMETETRKTRLGHCPGITLDMLTDGALSLTTSGQRKMQRFAAELIRNFKHAKKVEITNPSGTDISMSVEGRTFFTDTMIDWKATKWVNLPTGEVIVAPVENSLEGKLVCDLAIGGIGPINAPVEITAKKGRTEKIASDDDQVLEKLKDSLKTDDHANVVGEFAFGINPKARFVKDFIESEKILGTVHIAFGDNSDMPGGKNPSKNHTDLLISKPTVRIFNMDDSSIDVVTDGVFRRFRPRAVETLKC